MLRVTIELIPGGNEREKKTIGTAEIVNVGKIEGATEYGCVIRGPGIEEHVSFLSYIRAHETPWHLLRRVL